MICHMPRILVVEKLGLKLEGKFVENINHTSQFFMVYGFLILFLTGENFPVIFK